jgi:hypothetical protein
MGQGESPEHPRRSTPEICAYRPNPPPFCSKREWFEIVDALPADLTMIRYWDTAFQKQRTSDYTVGVKYGIGRKGVGFIVRSVLLRFVSRRIVGEESASVPPPRSVYSTCKVPRSAPPNLRLYPLLLPCSKQSHSELASCATSAPPLKTSCDGGAHHIQRVGNYRAPKSMRLMGPSQ